MLTSAQTWTVIGSIFGLIVAVLTGTAASLTSQQRSLRAEFVAGFAGLRAEMGAQRVELTSELATHRVELKSDIAQLRVETEAFRTETLLRFDGVDRRLDGVDRRLDNLDRDVQAVVNRVFRSGPEPD